MRHKHFSKIFCLGILTFLFAFVNVQAETVYKFAYGKGKKTFNAQYAEPIAVELSGVNKLDYKYDVNIEFEIPKPQTMPGPGLTFPISGHNVTYKNNSVTCVDALNDKLKERLVKFDQDGIDKWFIEVQNMTCITLIEDHKKDGAGQLKIEEKDISKVMFKTKPGGAIIITITAKPKKWKLKGDGSGWENEGEVVEKLEDLELEDETKVKKHMEPQVIRFNFPGPKGITFSMGPYLSFFLDRNKYERIKNPMFEEGSTDDAKKDKYHIGLTEESKSIYGIAAFWNAPFGVFSIGKGNKSKINWGVCWGVAYNVQEKIDRGVNGLMGIYFKPIKSPALLNLGISVGRVDTLPAGYEAGTTDEDGGYEPGTPIGENEEIPHKTKLGIGGFVSLSFIIQR